MENTFTDEVGLISLERFETPNGQPLFEHGSEEIRLLYTLDVHNYVQYIKTRSIDDLQRLFSDSAQSAVKSLKLADTKSAPFGGEWFQKIVLGSNVKLCNDVKILAHGGVKIGNNVVVGEQAQLVTVGHPMHPAQRHLLMIGPLAVEENAIIGSGAILLNPGVAEAITIGKNSVVMPGSIVSKSVPDYAVSGGVNKILLQGKEFFSPISDSDFLDKRLNEKGVAELAKLGIDAHTSLTAKKHKNMPENVRTIDHETTKDLAKLAEHFPDADQEILRNGLFFPPVYLAGQGAIALGSNILLNTGTILNTDGDIVIGDKTFLAPEAEVTAPAGAKVAFGKGVWCGAKVKVTANSGETITIGDGSVLAAGAEITKSIPEMSIVVGNNNIVGTLGPKNIFDVPEPWKDFLTCETQRLKLREKLAGMSIEQVQESLSMGCKRRPLPARLNRLAKSF